MQQWGTSFYVSPSNYLSHSWTFDCTPDRIFLCLSATFFTVCMPMGTALLRPFCLLSIAFTLFLPETCILYISTKVLYWSEFYSHSKKLWTELLVGVVLSVCDVLLVLVLLTVIIGAFMEASIGTWLSLSFENTSFLCIGSCFSWLPCAYSLSNVYNRTGLARLREFHRFYWLSEGRVPLYGVW